MKKNKIKNLLNGLIRSEYQQSDGFKAFNDGVNHLKSELELMKIMTLDDVNTELDSFKRNLNLDALITSLETIKTDFKKNIDTLSSQVEEQISQLTDISESSSNDVERIDELIKQKNEELKQFRNQLIEADKELDEKTDQRINQLNLEILELRKDDFDKNNELIDQVENLSKSLPKLRTELLSLLANKGSGNMNRQIFIGGADPLKKYTDFNLKAGSNVTITYANNDQTKKVDVTIASSGGGGGSTRSINSISTSTNAGNTSGTDYVYLCTGSLTLTLPDAVGNTNLYTVKNVGSGTITIATTSAQTIDSQSSIQLSVQYTSVDLISDTANWNLT